MIFKDFNYRCRKLFWRKTAVASFQTFTTSDGFSDKLLYRISVLISKDSSNRTEVFREKDVLKNFSKFIKKDTLAQMFPCEFWQIFKNNFFKRTHPVSASQKIILKVSLIVKNMDSTIWNIFKTSYHSYFISNIFKLIIIIITKIVSY